MRIRRIKHILNLESKIYNYQFSIRLTLPASAEYRGVAQLVARQLWELDAGRSSRPTPTTKKSSPSKNFFCLGLTYL